MSKYADMLDFTGKIVIITGGLSGAGRKISDVFAECGASLILTYNHSAKASEDFIASHPDCDVSFCKLDQRSPESITDFTSSVKEILDSHSKKVTASSSDASEYATISCLINNAGIYPSKDINDLTGSDWDEMMETNARGPFLLGQSLKPLMSANSSIINISSLNATNPARALAHYGASKAAIEMLTKSQAQAFGPEIRVNCIAPGLIFKPGQDEFIPGWTDSYKERSPLGKLVDPEDIGMTCLYLASDLSAAITGQTIAVDCGIQLAPCFYNEV